MVYSRNEWIMKGLLSDTEREWFTQIGFELAPTSKMRLLDENYLVYKAFVTASDYLVSFVSNCR